ncbi:RidA family protein [Pendulispora albinea]|uniref:RidA family protein n=1 Tax=Pendulispora albinea TaxID=2741071 RepID=A0ABZ2M478_9BACT
MTTTIRRINPPTLATPRGYSHIVEARGGRTVYIAGQVALDREGNLVGGGDLVAQTEQVFANLKAALSEVGADFTHVVKFGVFITKPLTPEDLAGVRGVRERYVGAGNVPPASTLVQVVALVLPELLIEIEAIAVVPDAP